MDDLNIIKDEDIQTINLDLNTPITDSSGTLGIELLADPKKTNKPTKYLEVSLTLDIDMSIFSINLVIAELLKTYLPSICFKSDVKFFKLPLLRVEKDFTELLISKFANTK